MICLPLVSSTVQPAPTTLLLNPPQGVAEYCCYFKSIEDANALRRRVSECFERAALPQTPEEVSAPVQLFACEYNC